MPVAVSIDVTPLEILLDRTYPVLHRYCAAPYAMKTNITVKLEADLVREAKVLAARRGTSVSRLVAEQLEHLVRRDRLYQSAMQRSLSRLEKGYDLQWQKPSTRDEIHER